MGRRFKKVISDSVFSAISVIAFAGCGNSAKSEDASKKDNSSSYTSASNSIESASSGFGVSSGAKYKVAICHQHMTNAFHNALAHGAETKGNELGVEVLNLDANQDAAEQIAQIEQCISSGYDAIIFEPVDSEGLVDVAKKAVEAGIPVLNFSSTIDGWEDICAGYIGASNVEGGEVEMQHVADLIDGKGNIAILTGPQGDAAGNLRHEGYDNILANYPDIKIVVEAAADWDTTKALETVESWKSSFDDLVAIVCENDGMAVGAANALGEGHGLVITGIDASDDGLEAIGNGKQTGTVAQDAAEQGKFAVQLAYDVITGKVTGTGNQSLVENVWVDADNLEEYIASKG